MRVPLALGLLFASPVLLCAQDIRGVWQPVEVRVTGGPQAGRHTSDVQPGLLILTERHYANVRVQGFVARGSLPANPTLEARCAAWEPFVASAGTYAVTDSTLSVEAIVAKDPGVLRLTTRIRVMADTLWLFFREPRDGSERVSKLVRIERARTS